VSTPRILEWLESSSFCSSTGFLHYNHYRSTSILVIMVIEERELNYLFSDINVAQIDALQWGISRLSTNTFCVTLGNISQSPPQDPVFSPFNGLFLGSCLHTASRKSGESG